MSGRRVPLLVLALLGAVHLWIVFSIADQPMNAQMAKPADRSVVFPLFNDSVHRLGPFADFFAVYQAGFCVRQATDFYANRVPSPGVPYFYVFRYLPVVAYGVGVPLSHLPARAAAGLWILLLEALLVVLLVLFWRKAQDDRIRLLGAAVLLLSSPFFLELHMGQFTFGTLALCAIALLLLEGAGAVPASGLRQAGGGGRRPGGEAVGEGKAVWIAAGCFTAAVLMKVFPLVLAPILVRRGRAGLICLGTAIAALLLLNLPWFAGHPGMWRHYLDRNFSPGAVWDGLNPGNFGLVYLLHLLWKAVGGTWTREGWVVFVQVWRFLVLGGAALLILLSRRHALLAGGALLVFAYFAAFHHVWEHHWSGALAFGTLLLLPEAYSSGNSGTRERGIRFGALVLCLVLWAMPSPFLPLDRHYCPTGADPNDTWPMWARILTPSFKVIPLVFLLAGLARWTWAEGFFFERPRSRS